MRTKAQEHSLRKENPGSRGSSVTKFGSILKYKMNKRIDGVPVIDKFNLPGRCLL